MKHLVICLLAVFLTACSDSTTPLVEMTKYEIEKNEQLQELEIEYVTYGEMKEEPIEDWPFDMEKKVMEDDDIIGYEISFPETEDKPGLTVEELAKFLNFAIDPDVPISFDDINEAESTYEFGTYASFSFKEKTYRDTYLIGYTTKKPYFDSDEYYITSGSIYLAD